MTEFRGGAGGYGGISTMNQDQRQGRYYPHKTISKYEEYSTNMTVVACRDCGAEWRHRRGEPWGSSPPECQKLSD